ncbi:hypothetical protein KY310_02900 [Candidatus Woesearchaeota archaeon]|nr:hypothetical protein [Candidatus Woesearchaeota archaeon]
MDYDPDKEKGYVIRAPGSKVHTPSEEYYAFLLEYIGEIQQDIEEINKEREKQE